MTFYFVWGDLSKIAWWNILDRTEAGCAVHLEYVMRNKLLHESRIEIKINLSYVEELTKIICLWLAC
jgi:hypothetical protein